MIARLDCLFKRGNRGLSLIIYSLVTSSCIVFFASNAIADSRDQASEAEMQSAAAQMVSGCGGGRSVFKVNKFVLKDVIHGEYDQVIGVVFYETDTNTFMSNRRVHASLNMDFYVRKARDKSLSLKCGTFDNYTQLD